MINYTIQAGDNLSKIAKQFYGDKLKSNEDYQKAIGAIAKNNDIKDVNLIFSGAKLNMPNADSIFDSKQTPEVKNTQKTPKQEKPDASTNIFSQLENWEKSHEELMALSSSIEEYDSNKEELGTSFDFMEGFDVNDKNQYDKQTLKLAQGEIKAKDIDDDGLVSYNEYLIDELGGETGRIKEMISSGVLSEDDAVSMVSEAIIDSNKVFNIIDLMESDGSLASEGDKKLDIEEFQAYYQHLDEYTGNSDGSTLRDGKIDIDFVTQYPEYLANQVSITPEIESNAQKIALTLLGLNKD